MSMRGEELHMYVDAARIVVTLSNKGTQWQDLRVFSKHWYDEFILLRQQHKKTRVYIIQDDPLRKFLWRQTPIHSLFQ